MDIKYFKRYLIKWKIAQDCRYHLELNSFTQKKKQGKRIPSRWVAVIEERPDNRRL